MSNYEATISRIYGVPDKDKYLLQIKKIWLLGEYYHVKDIVNVIFKLLIKVVDYAWPLLCFHNGYIGILLSKHMVYDIISYEVPFKEPEVPMFIDNILSSIFDNPKLYYINDNNCACMISRGVLIESTIESYNLEDLYDYIDEESYSITINNKWKIFHIIKIITYDYNIEMLYDGNNYKDREDVVGVLTNIIETNNLPIIITSLPLWFVEVL